MYVVRHLTYKIQPPLWSTRLKPDVTRKVVSSLETYQVLPLRRKLRYASDPFQTRPIEEYKRTISWFMPIMQHDANVSRK